MGHAAALMQAQVTEFCLMRSATTVGRKPFVIKRRAMSLARTRRIRLDDPQI